MKWPVPNSPNLRGVGHRRSDPSLKIALYISAYAIFFLFGSIVAQATDVSESSSSNVQRLTVLLQCNGTHGGNENNSLRNELSRAITGIGIYFQSEGDYEPHDAGTR